MRTRRLLVVLIAISIVAITARWWLPALLNVLSVNQDLIQTLDSGISIVSNVIAALSAIGSFILWQEQRKPEVDETLDQRNRRILLNHVENFWVKGVLEKSLHGAAMLELGIKEDPEAVTYPWAIKKEATGETLPTGTSMLEIFEQIGMGRSLLILGAPGSGKTTMLLELARQLIERARQNADEPIPMVFNLASWTEKLSLADWLAQELNNLYYVPRKTAPDWVKGNKLLLLLDGLDEVRQESRAKCVEAINQFRNEHGLTSLAVCSRSQDYEELGAKLAFEGAIEVQPLTQKQVAAFFNRFGKEMAGLKQVLKKDSALREMAETPLFLSIMAFVYRNAQSTEINQTEDLQVQRGRLFDAYITRMFDRSGKLHRIFKKEKVIKWLSWLSNRMMRFYQISFLIEEIKPEWLGLRKQEKYYSLITRGFMGLIVGTAIGWFMEIMMKLFPLITIALTFVNEISTWLNINLGVKISEFEMPIRMLFGIFGLLWAFSADAKEISEYNKSGSIKFNWLQALQSIKKIPGLILFFGILGFLSFYFAGKNFGFYNTIFALFFYCLFFVIAEGFRLEQLSQTSYPGQKISLSSKNALIFGSLTSVGFGVPIGAIEGINMGLFSSIIFGLLISFSYGGLFLITHYAVRIILYRHDYLPYHIIPFLDYCTDLIFLRRVGGGYIFVHRLLMEHFAAMYKEKPLVE